MKKFLLVTGALSTFAISTTVLAAYVGGGEWHYGVGWTGTYAYSNYIHDENRHSATVQHGSDKDLYDKSIAGAGAWAKASVHQIPPTGFNYYWSNNA